MGGEMKNFFKAVALFLAGVLAVSMLAFSISGFLWLIFPEIRKPTQTEPVLTYHHNRIYIDNVKTEYTLKEIRKGVYVIRKGESK